jgi:hypothetical protein
LAIAAPIRAAVAALNLDRVQHNNAVLLCRPLGFWPVSNLDRKDDRPMDHESTSSFGVIIIIGSGRRPEDVVVALGWD